MITGLQGGCLVKEMDWLEPHVDGELSKGCLSLSLQSHLQALVNAQGTETEVFAGLSPKAKWNVLLSRRYMPTKQTLLLQ